MSRRSIVLALAFAVALVAAPVVYADGGSLGGFQGDPGISDGAVRFVALQSAENTVLQEVRQKSGTFVRWATLRGSWGVPQITYGQDGLGGLTADGRLLVLVDLFANGSPLKKQSRFLVFDTRRFRSRDTIALRGDFSFDASSPSGRIVYLIQHLSAQNNANRYVVRAYDRWNHTLLARRIADRTQKGWVMQGYPLARETSPSGRFVYTLYQNQGGTPFIHALDTAAGTAHCIGVPWPAGKDQTAFYNLRLTLARGGRTLAVHWRNGRSFLSVDTRTFRISHPGGGLPWWLVGGLAGAFATLVLLGGTLRRWRVRPLFALRGAPAEG